MGEFHEEIMDRGKSEGGFLHLSPEAETKTKLSFVVLSCAREAYAVEIGKVREIIRLPRITWVPGAKPPVKGLINLRGSIIAVLDLAEILSGARIEPDSDARIIVVESGAVTVGLLVESASSVEDIPASDLHPPMTTLDASHRQFIVAQTNIEQRLVGVLDVDSLIDQAQKMQPDA